MKVKALALVSGILVVLAVAAFAVQQWMNAPSDTGRVGQPLMTGVEPVNAARIEVVSADRTVTLDTADGATWTVAQQHDFPVDTKKIKSLFIKLTTVKLAHKVTDDPGKQGTLGVLTRAENGGKFEKDKTGRLLAISDKDGKPLFQLVIGTDRLGQGAMTFGGTYVRYPGERATYLVSDAVLVDLRPEDWIDTVVLEMEADKTLKSIQVQRSGERVVQVTRDKPGTAWTLAGLPAEQLDQDMVKRLTNQLAGLDIFRVAAGDANAAEMGRKRTGHVEFEFFDKRRFSMDVGEAKGQSDFRYLNIRAALDPSVKDDALQQWVQAFNKRFGGRLLGVYDWDGGRMLQGWTEYKKKQDKKS